MFEQWRTEKRVARKKCDYGKGRVARGGQISQDTLVGCTGGVAPRCCIQKLTSAHSQLAGRIRVANIQSKPDTGNLQRREAHIA